ncbi:AAA-ATPase, partial [Candidatus Omnitrophus magneticus]
MRIQKLPVGYSDFKTIIDNKFYYIDKTLFIKEIIDESCNVILLPRPRRFGKTLNLSMLRYFFEKTEKSNGYLFKDLAICRLGEEYMNKQGAYPVIFLTLKDVKEKTWDTTYRGIKDLIQNEFLRHKYLKNWTGLEKEEKEYFNKITSLEGSEKDYENSLKTLSLFLERYHNKKVIILLDEYDTPIQSGYLENFYEPIISFMRNFLSGGFKDNTSL